MESRQGDRIIALVDMDCFYVQVEQKLNPEYQGKPCAVVQYNTWKGGGIIAVNYEARARGVGRKHRGEEAQRICPEIHLFRVPEVRGKADLTRYREAGASVLEVLCKFCECVERASIDEAYLDLTCVINERMKSANPVVPEQIPNTFVAGWESGNNENGALQDWLKMIFEEDHLYNDRMLAVAAVLVEEVRAAVYNETGYRCSAGIAHNKMLAKLSCGLHKPNKQTVLPESSIPLLYDTIPINKVRNLGGKFGEQVAQKFSAKTMGDLLKLSRSQFINGFGDKSGCWLYNVSRGIENEPVVPRQLPKSIGCGKNFPGKACLNSKEKVMHWAKQLSIELEERLLKDQENNCRIARLLTVTVRQQGAVGYSVASKSCPIYLYNAEKLLHDSFATLQKFNTSSSVSEWSPAILSLAMSAGKFEDKIDNSMCDIQTYFQKSPIKRNAIGSEPSTSDIDTVIGLLDAEPSVKPSTEIYNNLPSKIHGNQSNTTLSHSDRPTSNIDSFFSNKQTSATSEASRNTIFDTDNHVQNCIEVTSASENYNSAVTVSVGNTDRNNGMIDHSKPSDDNSGKVKGFFARKLEERTKSLNNKPSEPPANYISDAAKLDNSNSIQSKYKIAALICGEKVVQVSTQSASSKMAEISDNIDSNNMKSTSSNFVQPKYKIASLICGEKVAQPSSSHAKSDIHTGNSAFSLQNNTTELDPELTSLCSKCNHRIPIWEEVEHSDYHIAVELSRELKKDLSAQQNRTVQSSGKGVVPKPNARGSRKRGNLSKSASRSKKPAQQNTLDAFFK